VGLWERGREERTATHVPGLHGERNDGHEAEGEPLPALVDVAAEVAAVLALHG